MRALLLICIVLGACGRFGFDDSSDLDAAADAFVCAPTGHDEDSDGVDDACDVCPHIAGAQADGDGDRVGDACDPEPGNPRQRIVVFDPFLSIAAPWIEAGGVVIAGGRLELAVPGQSRYLSRPYTLGTDLFVIRGTTGVAGNGSHLLAITAGNSTAARFYCELFDNSAASKLQFTYTFDNVNYMFGTTAPAAMPFASGSGTLSFAASATSATCGSTWHGEALSATGTVPAISVETLLLYAENLDVRLDYFVQIHTDD